MTKNLHPSNPLKSRYLPHCKVICGILLSLFIAFQSGAQGRAVTGKVISADDKSALPGVNIVVKGTTNGTITGVDGTFSITATNDDVLVLSYVGYKTIEESVGSRTTIDIALSPDLTSLEEVVVIGYGAVKKTDLTGAVSTIDAKELTKLVSPDVTQMMQGRTPGVSVTTDGQPGASPKVSIRGVGTLGNADAQPLYVVDGLPLSGSIANTGDNFQPGANTSPIRDLNPNDIESIQVLKDASAGAIYGVRAANGVVIITTKKGKYNQPVKVDVSMYAGVQHINKTIPVTQRVDYQMINRETFLNGGQPGSIPPGNNPSNPNYITNVDTNWQKEGLKDGSVQNVNIGLNGGGANTTYAASVDYFNNQGTLVGNGPSYRRYSTRLNVDTKKGIFRFGENLYVMRSEETSQLRLSGTPGANPPFINDLVWSAPTIPIYESTREGGYGGSSSIQNALSLNIIGLNNLVQAHRTTNRAIAGMYAELDIAKGLTYKINGQFDYTQQVDDLFVPMYDLGFFYPNGSAYFDKQTVTRTNALIENTFTYKKSFGKHNLTLLAGQTFQRFNSDRVGARTSGLQKPYFPSLSNGLGTKTVSEAQDVYSIASLLGRIDYNYDDRYFVTANIRNDGSSKFPENNRFRSFPSVAVAWKIHRDFAMPEFIRELKLRAGYGQVGNAGLINYAYLNLLNTNIPYAFGDTRAYGSAAVAVVDPNIKWETRTTRNVALDVGLFKGVDFTLEYYSNRAEDIVVPINIPTSVGALPATYFTNAGSMQNSGIEFSMNYRKTIGDFFFEVSPNFYTLKNEVLSLPVGSDNLTDQNERTQSGGALGRHYGWVYEGIFQTSDDVKNHAFQNALTGPGDVKYKDLNNDGKIDDSDRTFIGNAIPNFYYGLNITAEYKGFDFTIFGSGSSGAVAQNNLYKGLMSSQSSGNTNYHQDILARWTPTNTNTDIPRMIYLDPNNNGRPSDRPGWLQSTAYFRLNTISLGYTLPSALVDKMHMTKIRVYATGQNLATFTAYKGFNPDFNSLGILSPGFDFGTYPRPATYMLGIQASF